MADSRTRLLFFADFAAGNFPSALHTLAQWSQAASRLSDFRATIGLTTSLEPDSQIVAQVTLRQALALLKGYCGGLDVVSWNHGAANALVEAGAVFPAFNYGSIVNKGLLLASAAECAYAVRVDPGTRPPERLEEHLTGHIDYIRNHPGAVVSRGYAGRLALRDSFVRPDSVDAHRELVRRYTTINVFDQLTGGALFTSAVPGVPAVPFQPFGAGQQLTLVWASDDGVFQCLDATRGSRRLEGGPVPRFDQVGKLKSSFEYYRGVTGAVYLFGRLRGRTTAQALASVDEFIDRLKPLLDSDVCQANDETLFTAGRNVLDWKIDFRRELVTPDGFLEAIEQGVQNHRALVPRWLALSEDARTSGILWRP